MKFLNIYQKFFACAAIIIAILPLPSLAQSQCQSTTQSSPNENSEGAGNRAAEALGRESLPALRAWRSILARVGELHNRRLRLQVLELLNDAAPSYQLRAPTPEARLAVLAELKAANLAAPSTTVAGIYPAIKDPHHGAQSFIAAPGSYYCTATASAGHHSYPGGLAVHTAFNLRAALSLMNSYQANYQNSGQFLIDRDLIIAAVALHDVMKTLVFQWNEDGTEFSEEKIADTGSHHILGLAEQFARELPPAVIIATASAHNPPRPGELRRKVIDYLRAAAIIARVDPVKYGVLSFNGKAYDLTEPARPEHFIINLSDSDYQFSEFAASACVDNLRDQVTVILSWPAADLAGARFNWLRNTLLSRTTGIGGYQMIRQNERSWIKMIKTAATRSAAIATAIATAIDR